MFGNAFDNEFNDVLKLWKILSEFDFPGASLILEDQEERGFPQILFIRPPLISIELLRNLDSLSSLVRRKFVPSKDRRFYLMLLDVLMNKFVDISSITDPTYIEILGNIGCSVLHQQTPKMVDLLCPGHLFVPSEKLYHPEYMSFLLKSDTISYYKIIPYLSLWMGRYQINWLGIEQVSDLESKNADLQFYGLTTIANAQTVKLLKPTLKPNQIILMEPKSHVEYEAMKKLERLGQVSFTPTLSLAEVEDNKERWEKILQRLN